MRSTLHPEKAASKFQEKTVASPVATIASSQTTTIPVATNSRHRMPYSDVELSEPSVSVSVSDSKPESGRFSS